jgi:predicted acylesterase/phospholipase RssA
VDGTRLASFTLPPDCAALHKTVHGRETKMADATRERCVLVLQGGGALGAYQAGVFEALAGNGYSPDWVAGISIGAVNAALIAGNPPERRVRNLRAFWEQASSRIPFPPRLPMAGAAACSTRRPQLRWR